MSAVVRLLVISALALLLTGAPAGAAPWSPSAPVAVGAGAGTPSAAIAADGSDVLAVVDNNGVESTVRAPGETTFGPPQVVAPPPSPGGRIANLRLVQVPGAETVAVWSRAAPGERERIEWAERPPGGVFGPVREVPRTGLPDDALTDDIRAGAGANGDVVLALTVEGTQASGGFGFRVFATVRPAGGEFAGAVTVGGLGSLSPSVAVGADGDAVVAWLQGGATRPGAIRASRRPPGGAFEAPTTLDRTTGPGLAQPFVAPGVGGETVAMWYRRDGRVKRVYFSVRPAGASRFAAVGTLGSAPTRRYALAGGGSGDVAAVWDDADRSGPVLVVRRRFPGHGFAAARKLSHQPSVRTLAGAVTGDGTLVAAWQRVSSGDRTELWVAGQERSGRRTELVRLQEPAFFPGFALAAGPDGRALATWTIPGSAPRWAAR
ncbi:MAG: hypothetical protein ACJ76T_21260 [Solirubrobacteraceae bacterium]